LDQGLASEIQTLVSPQGGAPLSDNPDESRSRHRERRPVPRFGQVIATLLTAVNDGRRQRGFRVDLTLREVLRYHPAGKEILREGMVATVDKQLAKNAQTLVERAGRSMTEEVTGILSNKISTKEAKRRFGKSSSLINTGKRLSLESEFNPSRRGPFQTLQQKPHGTKNRIPEIERVRAGWVPYYEHVFTFCFVDRHRQVVPAEESFQIWRREANRLGYHGAGRFLLWHVQGRVWWDHGLGREDVPQPEGSCPCGGKEPVGTKHSAVPGYPHLSVPHTHIFIVPLGSFSTWMLFSGDEKTKSTPYAVQLSARLTELAQAANHIGGDDDDEEHTAIGPTQCNRSSNQCPSIL
jgi:hypothetical protein